MTAIPPAMIIRVIWEIFSKTGNEGDTFHSRKHTGCRGYDRIADKKGYSDNCKKGDKRSPAMYDRDRTWIIRCKRGTVVMKNDNTDAAALSVVFPGFFLGYCPGPVTTVDARRDDQGSRYNNVQSCFFNHDRTHQKKMW